MNGEWMATEMAEQPSVVAALASRRPDISAAVTRLLPDAPHGVMLLGRGSSANAAVYGRLALAIALGRPTMLAPLSWGNYGVDIDLHGWASIALSQSGRTPEIEAALARHRLAGAATMAITNAADSPLAAAAELSIDLAAGPELAVPATKSVIAQIVACAIIASAFADGDRYTDGTWHDLGAAIEFCLGDSAPIEAAQLALAETRSLTVCGRGYGYPAAREGALKIKELTGITAEAYSHLDFLHGPIAVASSDVPTVVVSMQGRTAADADRLIAELHARSAPMLIIGDRAGADIAVPAGLPESLAIIPVIVRLQQLAYAVAVERGIEPDQPHRLSKITIT